MLKPPTRSYLKDAFGKCWFSQFSHLGWPLDPSSLDPWNVWMQELFTTEEGTCFNVSATLKSRKTSWINWINIESKLVGAYAWRFIKQFFFLDSTREANPYWDDELLVFHSTMIPKRFCFGLSHHQSFHQAQGFWQRCGGKSQQNWRLMGNHHLLYFFQPLEGTIWLWLTVCHGKSPFLIGKPSIPMGHGFHGYVK